MITFEEEWFKRNEIKFWTNIFSIVVHSTNLSLEQEPRLTRDYSTYPSHEQAPDRESNKRWIYTSWTRFQKSSPGRDNTRRGGERNSGAAITPIKLSLRREKHRSINPSIVPPSLLPTNKRISPVKILRSTLKQAQRERERERKGENLHPTEAINHNWTRRCFAYTGQRGGGCENAFRGENKSKREIRK